MSNVKCLILNRALLSAMSFHDYLREYQIIRDIQVNVFLMIVLVGVFGIKWDNSFILRFFYGIFLNGSYFFVCYRNVFI